MYCFASIMCCSMYCLCVNMYYCHRVSSRLQLTNIYIISNQTRYKTRCRLLIDVSVSGKRATSILLYPEDEKYISLKRQYVCQPTRRHTPEDFNTVNLCGIICITDSVLSPVGIHKSAGMRTNGMHCNSFPVHNLSGKVSAVHFE
jgi:hypothetical protein